MNRMIAFCMTGLCLCIGLSCSNKGKTTAQGPTDSVSVMSPKYATGYEVKDSAGVRLVDVGKDYHFALVA
ncbi:MAG: iron ABC transporter substrate-binding protein, partial [Bacteroidales bacterium]|nr:iron ABC transporter substrate-binding protein [Bacteroidales bacterium]